MSLMRRLRLGTAALAIASIALLSSLGVQHVPARAAAPRASGPSSYYLSLGDSLAYGYQPFAPIRQGFGYYDFLSTGLEALNPSLQPLNLGCPGESSTTFLNGGCPAAVLNRYTGTQFDTALSFLKAHQGQVSPITYVMGANDLLQIITDTAKLTATLQTFAVNEDRILKALREAAPTADIVTLDYYNPFVVAITDTAQVPASVAPTLALNSIIDKTAARYNVKVANMFAAFNTPVQSPLLCNLTYICSPFHDIHPTIAGYRLMTEVLAATLGYPGFAASTTPTNPFAISRGVLTGPATITWLWTGETNAQGYDMIIYHYDASGQPVQDRSITLSQGTHSFTLVGATCGISYELKIRSRGPNRPAPYFTPGDGRQFSC